MKIVDGKITLEQGDKVFLEDGRSGEFLRFNCWDGSLVYVNIGGIEEMIWVSELDLDKIEEMN